MWSLLVSLGVLLAAAQMPAGTGTVAGRIVEAGTGEPISGATVSLSPLQAPTSAAVATVRLLMNQTNVDGMFEISAVPAGRWRVQIQKEGYIPPNASSLTVDVGGGIVKVRDVQLDRGGAIIGRVLDSRGSPVVRISVLAMQQLRNRDGSVRSGFGASAQTNDLGEFRISGLAPGEYTVVAQPVSSVVNPFTGGSPTAAPTVHVRTFYPGSADSAQASPVSVSRGAMTRGIEFSMLSAAAYQVFGTVVDPAGKPVGGASVRLVQASPPLPATAYQASPSALDGTFVIVNVPAGRYSAQAVIPLVTRDANGGISASIRSGPAGGPGSVEVVVRDGNVEGVRLVATPP